METRQKGLAVLFIVMFVLFAVKGGWADGDTLIIVRAADDSLWKSVCTGNNCDAFSGFPGRFAQQPSVTWDEHIQEWVVIGVAADDSIWRATFKSDGTFNNDWAVIPGSTPSPAGLSGGKSFSSIANGQYSTVSGGGVNTASAFASTVSGGVSNTASGFDSTVSGGNANTASGHFSTVSGGSNNTASGTQATVSGGWGNVAAGVNSFAAGCTAHAQADGTFIWADNNCDMAPTPVTTPNQFYVRASGGVVLRTNAFGAFEAGVTVPSGASAWSALSDRNTKENFAEINSREVLERLAMVPIRTWNWKSQDSSIRHIGPTAQDFHAAFEVGEDERHISTVDSDGVALAAIQGLYQLLKEKDGRIENLEKALAEIQQRLATGEMP